MILNAYAVLDLFLVLVRFFLGLGVILGSWYSRNQGRRGGSPEHTGHGEDSGYLVFLGAIILLGINLASWPLFYLLLQSYVTAWPGVMCIYGVTQIGSGSIGVSRLLPGLLTILQVTKPILVFVSGWWLVLHLVNRRTSTSPLKNRLLLALVLLGFLAGADAVVEAAYLIIPKTEIILSVGCCTNSFSGVGQPERFLPFSRFSPETQGGLSEAYYGLNLAMVLALFLSTRLWRPNRMGLGVLFLGAVLSLAVNGVFLTEVAAPILLHMPQHHCPYDLPMRVPESMVAVVLFFIGNFAVGWAALAGWLCRSRETAPFLNETIGHFLALGQFGYLSSLVMLTLELYLA